MFKRPTPAMLVAVLALFAATAGVSYAAVQGPPSFTARGVASVSGTATNPTPLPVAGANASAISNHGMTVSGTTHVVAPVSGNYLVTLNGNCNGGAASPRFQVREGLLTTTGPIHLQVGGAAGNPALAGASTVHLNAGARLAMSVVQTGATVNCGATLGVSLLSSDA
jgi:hypothetical protein